MNWIKNKLYRAFQDKHNSLFNSSSIRSTARGMKVGNYEIAAGARIDPFYFSLNGQNFAKYDTALRRDQDRLGFLPSHDKKKDPPSEE